MDGLMQYAGIAASIWIVLGVFVASLFYPNYSHSRQFCSELGAFDSPVKKLSPAINNYPLGFLFIAFGYYLVSEFSPHVPTVFIGVMVMVHGLCTWICGWFPMDADPYTTEPSLSCQIHSWSGVVMLISLIVAPAIVICSDFYPSYLRIFSAICILGCIGFSYKLAQAFSAKTVPGLYQRLSYGCQIFWLFGFSCFIVS